MLTISVEDYRPSPTLDEELAELGHRVIKGWPDHAPVDASLARAMLRPAGMTATTLALHRDAGGRLVAAAAVRWPATLDTPGRLWGPMVHPDARGKGLGRTLMATVTEVLAAHPGVLISTTDIPESRAEGWSLFERAGWQVAAPSHLLALPLTDATGAPRIDGAATPGADVAPGDEADLVRPDAGEDAPGGARVRATRTGEYVAPALAELFAACRPDTGAVMARDAFVRWSQDSRYVPDGLLLAESGDQLVGAALVYPSFRPDEPAEALLAELLVTPRLDPATAEAVRLALVRAAVRAGVAAGANVARAVVDDPDLLATLRGAGFTVVDRLRRYTCRGARPA